MAAEETPPPTPPQYVAPAPPTPRVPALRLTQTALHVHTMSALPPQQQQSHTARAGGTVGGARSAPPSPLGPAPPPLSARELQPSSSPFSPRGPLQMQQTSAETSPVLTAAAHSPRIPVLPPPTPTLLPTTPPPPRAAAATLHAPPRRPRMSVVQTLGALSPRTTADHATRAWLESHGIAQFSPLFVLLGLSVSAGGRLRDVDDALLLDGLGITSLAQRLQIVAALALAPEPPSGIAQSIAFGAQHSRASPLPEADTAAAMSTVFCQAFFRCKLCRGFFADGSRRRAVEDAASVAQGALAQISRMLRVAEDLRPLMPQHEDAFKDLAFFCSGFRGVHSALIPLLARWNKTSRLVERIAPQLERLGDCFTIFLSSRGRVFTLLDQLSASSSKFAKQLRRCSPALDGRNFTDTFYGAASFYSSLRSALSSFVAEMHATHPDAVAMAPVLASMRDNEDHAFKMQNLDKETRSAMLRLSTTSLAITPEIKGLVVWGRSLAAEGDVWENTPKLAKKGQPQTNRHYLLFSDMLLLGRRDKRGRFVVSSKIGLAGATLHDLRDRRQQEFFLQPGEYPGEFAWALVGEDASVTVFSSVGPEDKRRIMAELRGVLEKLETLHVAECKGRVHVLP